MKDKIKEIFTELVESIEVNGYYRQVNRLNVSNNGKVDTIYIHFSDFKNHDDTLPEMDLGGKIHNKWYFRLYNKIIEEYTNSDEDYLAMTDNYSVINFYTDWISKLEYAPYGLYLRVNLTELTGFIRDKKISKLLE
jgi:hypothetical protein